MPRIVPIPRRLLGTAFLTSDTVGHSLTRGRLRGADVAHPFHGVSCLDLDLASILGLCRAYEPRLGPGEVFSHSTAAAIFGVPLPESIEVAPLHVSSRGSVSRPRSRAVVGHRLTVGDFAMFGGLSVTDPATTWCHLAAFLSREDLVAAGDFLASGRRLPGGSRTEPLTSIALLEIAVRRFRGGRGVTRLVWAVSRIRFGVDSRPESLTRLLLVAAGIPEPRVNAPTPVDGGRLVLHADLTLEEWRVVFDYEGDGHRTDARTFRNDIERRELFEAAGWRHVRVTADHVFVRPGPFTDRVKGILRERGWRG
ncbi:hypothetical protein [Lacisediminihabitans profunda]|uniref:DUF559 domain-containing protein n=1 Tax=Lacisediminihabitans profunda TaxID=2594790 RepID=A0A5C8UJS9_9MICO|nr:hypothetical protein [Lacisediminihabitans profunda]TXN28508.1 hypothetical protein FVP33_16835 [Lacisediminihabitans profunda]